MEIQSLRKILSEHKKDTRGKKMDLVRRADKEINLEELKQKELVLLCTLNNIHQNKDKKVVMVSKLMNHKNQLLVCYLVITRTSIFFLTFDICLR